MVENTVKKVIHDAVVHVDSGDIANSLMTTLFILEKILLKDRPRINTSFLLYILEKNDINKTCRSCFEKMFLFVKIFCQP